MTTYPPPLLPSRQAELNRRHPPVWLSPIYAVLIAIWPATGVVPAVYTINAPAELLTWTTVLVMTGVGGLAFLIASAGHLAARATWWLMGHRAKTA